jgi:hypothetical protein
MDLDLTGMTAASISAIQPMRPKLQTAALFDPGHGLFASTARIGTVCVNMDRRRAPTLTTFGPPLLAPPAN